MADQSIGIISLPSDVLQHHHSPAVSVRRDALDTPAPSLAPPGSPGLLTRSRPIDGEDSCLLPTEPGCVDQVAVATPSSVTDSACVPPTNMNLIVGGALAPLPTSLPRAPRRLKANPGLCLPSFEALGIASPHPDRFGALAGTDGSVLGGLVAMMRDATSNTSATPHLPDPLDTPQFSSLHLQRQEKLFIGAGRAVATPFLHDVATLTPPDEAGGAAWNTVAAGFQRAIDSSPPDPDETVSNNPGDHEQREAMIPSLPAALQSTPSAGHVWYGGALQALLENLQTAALPANPLRILSHALPSPSTRGHIFPTIIDGIHGSTPAQPTVWINIFHAIQGRFNIADIPTSPPSTPGPAIGGDDYFTQKVFDTAVSISDYQKDLSSLPRSPRPIVPPSSINVSIVERYIPPATTHEFENMFDPSGPSILVDRLVELSPNNGTLIFVYPTRKGAETFMREYLGPLLDPQLRSLVVVNGLSSNLSRSLGRMVAVDHLPDFQQMHRSMDTLCAKLTQRSSSIERFHERRATFSLVYAACEEVHVDRDAWSRDWWAKQEKQRIRDMMTRYSQDAQKQSSNEHVERSPTPTELLQQLLDGVIRKSSYPAGQLPKGKGLEVSIFVIRKSD